MVRQSAIPDGLLTQMLDLGVSMIACGADVNLVEESLVRIGTSYGARDMNVFVITSSILVTMLDDLGKEHTQSRRIHTALSNNFGKLERLNTLCRRCCDEKIGPAQIAAELQRINNSCVSRSYLYVGSILAAGSFAVFFGGSPLDGVVSALFAVLICVLQSKFRPYCPNEIVFDFVAALVSGLGICLVAHVIPGLNIDKIIIGDIMLLIPGIAITNAMRDMLAGDTVAGALRLIESLLWAGALALGYMVAIMAVGA